MEKREALAVVEGIIQEMRLGVSEEIIRISKGTETVKGSELEKKVMKLQQVEKLKVYIEGEGGKEVKEDIEGEIDGFHKVYNLADIGKMRDMQEVLKGRQLYGYVVKGVPYGYYQGYNNQQFLMEYLNGVDIGRLVEESGITEEHISTNKRKFRKNTQKNKNYIKIGEYYIKVCKSGAGGLIDARRILRALGDEPKDVSVAII